MRARHAVRAQFRHSPAHHHGHRGAYENDPVNGTDILQGLYSWAHARGWGKQGLVFITCDRQLPAQNRVQQVVDLVISFRLCCQIHMRRTDRDGEKKHSSRLRAQQGLPPRRCCPSKIWVSSGIANRHHETIGSSSYERIMHSSRSCRSSVARGDPVTAALGQSVV
jgi:hypothetical protein